MKIFPYSGTPDNFKLYGRLLLGQNQDEPPTPYVLRSCRTQGNQAVVGLEGVTSRGEAEGLVGRQVWVDRDALPELPIDEFYWHDLEGMDVVTSQGASLGKVSRLLSTGAHDILVVTDRGREYLIPALDGFVVAIDEETRTITVDPPDGLLDINV